MAQRIGEGRWIVMGSEGISVRQRAAQENKPVGKGGQLRSGRHGAPINARGDTQRFFNRRERRGNSAACRILIANGRPKTEARRRRNHSATDLQRDSRSALPRTYAPALPRTFASTVSSASLA